MPSRVELGVGEDLAGLVERDQRPAPHRGPQDLPGVRHVGGGGVAHQAAEDDPGLPGLPHALLGGDEPGQHRRAGRPSGSPGLSEVPDRGVDGAVDAVGEAVLGGEDLDDRLGGRPGVEHRPEDGLLGEQHVLGAARLQAVAVDVLGDRS